MVCVETLADWWNEIGCISSVFSFKVEGTTEVRRKITAVLYIFFLLPMRQQACNYGVIDKNVATAIKSLPTTMLTQEGAVTQPQ